MGGSILLALLGLSLGFLAIRVVGGYPPPPKELRALDRREAAVFSAAIVVLFPAGGSLARSGEEADVLGHLDRFVAVLGSRNQGLIRLLVLAVEQGTLLFPAPGQGGWRRFSALSAEQRALYLASWGASRFYGRRLVFTSLRALLTMGYFSDPVVEDALGLAPRQLPRQASAADFLWPPLDEAGARQRRLRESGGLPESGLLADRAARQGLA